MGCSSRTRDYRLIERSVFYGPFSLRNVSQATKMLLQLREKLHLSAHIGRKNKKRTTQQKVNFDDEYEFYLKSLDPKDWRMQDHYAVLGLKHSRFDAGENDIKQAYRKLVLRHHPDKRPENERTRKDGDYFTCITKAYEILGNKTSRRAYDSVDPYFDDGIPEKLLYDADEFFDVFARYFEYNARWSDITPVPILGDENTSKEDVEKFYNFWFNFRSWRDYSYEFEENETNSMDRAERRWMEKQNKTNRMKQKKEEMSRIRKLVDLAYKNDPRITKFKTEEREKKIAAKKAREEEIKASKLEAARLAKETEEKERKSREEAEAKKRQEQETIKAEQAQMKKSLKRIKKNIRDICKQNKYYADDVNVITHMTDLEAICEALSLEQLNAFYQQLTLDGKTAFLTKADEIRRMIKEERLNSFNTIPKERTCNNNNNSNSKPWSNKEVQLLIKAVNLFPAGTNNRWEVISNFLIQHDQENNNVRSSNEVLNKVKEMQKMKQNAAATGTEENNIDIYTATNSSRTWTNAEQQLLERGLKTYSASLNDRWERIAECIPNRTKEEVVQRYKDLVEAVKAKRLLQNKNSP